MVITIKYFGCFYTLYGNYYVYLCVCIVNDDYLCVFMCIYVYIVMGDYLCLFLTHVYNCGI